MIDINDYNYDLPECNIPKHPNNPRDGSKLLLYNKGEISEDIFCNISRYLPSQSLLVYNNTRVIHARLVFYRESGARIEVFCLEPITPNDYQRVFGCGNECTWKCMVGNAKKWKSPNLAHTIKTENNEITLKASIENKKDNTYIIRFQWHSSDPKNELCFGEILDLFGEIPIPPYLNRKSEKSDNLDYQTVYSKIQGSVAAPTAGLHFTDKVLTTIKNKNIKIEELTLHVGAGTFQPVKVQDATKHLMHKETIEIKKELIEALLQYMGNITVVGTTSVRTLESLYFIGEQLQKNNNTLIPCFQIEQFAPYQSQHTLNKKKAIENILSYMNHFNLTTIHAQTQIMIYPGYTFQYVDRMITNFHQPKSTLLLLISAFVHGDWKNIYAYALEHNFRFLSYGDSSLLIP